MGWSWHDEQATPLSILELVVEMIQDEAEAVERERNKAAAGR